MSEPFIVAGIGELLWDVFPSGKRLGGAPVNFSYHCHQLGASGYPVSAVGHDELGMEILQAVEGKNLSGRYIQTVHYPTGTVQVTLDENGKPSYEICTDVAWDYIPSSPELSELARQADAVCFGSLAQRSDVSCSTILSFLKAMRDGALKIFDVNLRQAFFSESIIAAALEEASILKLSDEELPILAQLFSVEGSVLEQLQQLLQKFNLRLLAYTRGPDGSILVTANEIDDHPGCPGDAVNSVGAGDSFTATLCMGLLNKEPLSEINQHANQVAAFVCSQDGATPELPPDLC
jgi:fructokinase